MTHASETGAIHDRLHFLVPVFRAGFSYYTFTFGFAR